MKKTKISAIIIVAIMLMVSICSIDTIPVQAASKSIKVGNGKYSITSKKTARFDRVSKKSVTTLSIPATVKIGKKTYKVTAIKANALKNNKKIKKLTIGKNVKTIGKNAFCCKNLKDITIKTTKLTMKSVGKNAFKGLNKKVVVTVPASKLEAYKKLLKARGVTGKNQKIVSSQDKKKDTTKINTKPTVNFKLSDGTDYTKYGTGDIIPFTIRTDIPIEMYGYWTIEKVKSDFKITCTCGKVFGTNENYDVHSYQTGHSSYTILKKKNNVFDASVWHPDNTPCSIAYYVTLPEGMEFVEDSISVAQLSRINTLLDAVETSNYTISIDGRNMTVRTNNIKSGGFCFFDGDVRYLPIVASFSAKVTDSAVAVNPVTASVSYSHGTNSGTIGAGSIPILTSALSFENQSQTGHPVSAGYTLYRLKQYALGTGYEAVGKEKKGTSFTFPALGTGQYKLVQTTTPIGYKRMDDYEFIIAGTAGSSGFTDLKITDLAGNTIKAPGGVAWTADLNTATLSSNIINEIDEKQTKEITATVKHDLNSEINTEATTTLKSTVHILEENGKISTSSVQEKNFPGYKVDSIMVNGNIADSLPKTVNGGDTVIYHYVPDESQKHTITARVRYFLGDTEQHDDNWSVQQEVQVLKDEIDVADASEGKQFEKSYEGYKLSKIVLTDSDGTRKDITVIPKTLKDGSSISYYYVVDDGLMETLSMTVKYSLEGEIQEDDTFVYSEEVKVTESDGYLKKVTLPEKAYTGYKFSRYEYEDGSPIGPSLARVRSGSTVVVRYNIDNDAQGTWTATVQHKCGEEVKKEIPLSVTGPYWDYGYEFGLYTKDITAEEYPGYRFDKITINGKEVPSLPEMLQDGDLVVFNYVQ